MSGYTPIGVIGYRTANSSSGGTGTAQAYWGRCYTDGNTAYYLVRNADTSNTIVVDIIMKILYIKTL